MGYKGTFLIVDAPLKGTAEQALATLGFADVAPLDDDIGIEQASYDAAIAVAEYDGRTIFAGTDFLPHATGEAEAPMRSLMDELGARRAVATWLESGTDSFGYAIVEAGRPTAVRFGGRYLREMEEYGEGLSADETRAMWAALHPWEVEYLGTAEPERDDGGRPLLVAKDGERSEDWLWGEDFVFELQRHMLGSRQDMDNDWCERPARCFRARARPRPVQATPRHRRDLEPLRAGWWLVPLVALLIFALRACGAF